MTQTSRCPCCGAPSLVPSPRGSDGPVAIASPAGTQQPGLWALDSLYREVRRIREIAEARETGQRPGPVPSPADSERRIAELTREVQELRATVARLRGSTARLVSAG